MDLRSQHDKILQWLAGSETESIPGNQSQSSEPEEGDHLETEIHNETDGSDEDTANTSDDEFFVPRCLINRSQIKIVYLFSTIHDQPAINIDSKKPESIEFYNSTKGAVDTVDQMCSIMSTSRKTNRWPLCLFYDILNLSIVNAYVIHVCNAIRNGKKPMKRRPFALEMADELMKPWLQERFQTITLQRNLKQIIAEILKIDDPQEGSSQDVPGTSKTCSYCPAKKRRMTTNFCKGCKKAICREHIVSMCNHCSMYNISKTAVII